MEEIVKTADDAVTHCQRMLGEKGRLTTAIPGFMPRAQQIQLAEAITRRHQCPWNAEFHQPGERCC